MPSMIDVKCMSCGNSFEARAADVKRGWGKYCSKSCKAHQQTKKQSKNKSKHKGYPTIIHYNDWDDEVINGDVVWSDSHRCWIDLRSDGAHPFDSEAAGFNNT